MADRNQMLRQISEISFVLDDLTLYLDTHPLDTEALNQFTQALAKRKELETAYAKAFEPLTRCHICPESQRWTWTDGPLPWEGGIA